MGKVKVKLTHKFFLAGISIILLLFFPYLYFGEDSYVIVHDNLDAAVPGYKFIVESNMLFSHNLASVKGVMGVLPRLAHPSEMDFITWLYYWLSPWGAYLTNLILIRVIAFVSIFLLLLKLTEKQSSKNSLILVTSFAVLFAMLPTWPSAGISIAGQPLIIYLFLLFSEGKKVIWPYIIIFSYTFYSSLVLSGLFFGIGLFVWLILHSLNRKSFNYRFFIGLIILVVGYVLSDYRLFLSVLDPDNYGFLSHRVEMEPFFHSNLLGEFFNYLFNGHYHAAKLPFVLGSLVIIATPFVFFMRKKFPPLTRILLVCVFVASFLSAIARWEGIFFIYEKISFLKSFQIDRFFFLVPILVILCVFLIYQRLFLNKYLRIFGGVILLFALLDIGWMDMNYRNLTKNSLGMVVKDPTYKEFFAKDLFFKIKTEIPLKDTAILNFGIHPSVAQFNGLITQDGYMSNYPLSKKYNFLEMLGEQWKQDNPESSSYIRTWGSRLYVLQDQFENQVRYKWNIDSTHETELQLNWDLIKASGVHYLLSTNPVLDEEVSLIQVYEDSSSAWRIFAYKL